MLCHLPFLFPLAGLVLFGLLPFAEALALYAPLTLLSLAIGIPASRAKVQLSNALVTLGSPAAKRSRAFERPGPMLLEIDDHGARPHGHGRRQAKPGSAREERR